LLLQRVSNQETSGLHAFDAFFCQNPADTQSVRITR